MLNENESTSVALAVDSTASVDMEDTNVNIEGIVFFDLNWLLIINYMIPTVLIF